MYGKQTYKLRTYVYLSLCHLIPGWGQVGFQLCTDGSKVMLRYYISICYFLLWEHIMKY